MSQKNHARLGIEQLEDRQLLAGSITFNPALGIVNVHGTRRNDTLIVSLNRAGNVRVVLSGGDHARGVFPGSQVREVAFQGGAGHSRVINRTSVPVVQLSGPLPLSSRGAPKGGGTPAVGPDGLTSDQELILQQTNAFRASRGLPALVINPQLQAAAQARADAEAASNTYYGDGGFPQDIDASGYPWTTAGQNDAYNYGYPDPAQQLVTQWWNSPPHQANMLGAKFLEVGIGYAVSANGTAYGVQLFGSTK
jgi:uncharacterized protein YkwD